MFPSRFRYEAPRSLDEAISVLGDGGDYAKVLAGGQSLVPMMKLRFASPELIVDINNLPGLAYHRADPDGTLRIGALCRHADLEFSDLLKGTQPTMAAAAPLVADPLVRNRGTLVGSLCHADPQGDWASVMLALGGSVIAQGPNGRRAIPLDGFVTGPFENTLEHDEIVVEAVVPKATGVRSGGSQRDPRGHRAHRSRRFHHRRLGGGGGADRQAAHRREHRGGRRARRGRGAAANRPPRQRGVQAPAGAGVRHPHPGRNRGKRGKGGLTMTTVYDDLGDEAVDEV